ncbi:unnamed protein product, partial [Strongylus vulgaris]
KPASSYSNLEEDHGESEGPVTIIDTNNVNPQKGNVGQVSQATNRGTTYNLPLNIRPIQVQPAPQYGSEPEPAQPYAPKPLQRINVQPSLGYQEQGVGYGPPQPPFQPPSQPLLQPPPIQLPQLPPVPAYQPLPTYQISPQAQPQQVGFNFYCTEFLASR